MQKDVAEIFMLMRAHSLGLHVPSSMLYRVQRAGGYRASRSQVQSLVSHRQGRSNAALAWSLPIFQRARDMAGLYVTRITTSSSASWQYDRDRSICSRYLICQISARRLKGTTRHLIDESRA